MNVLTQIYASDRKPGYYLYVPKDANLQDLPEALIKPLGALRKSLLLMITPAQKLANADPVKVLESLTERGFYLQLPPKDDPLEALYS
jgi:uncharacterized protein YcgL (UPF0745 family)